MAALNQQRSWHITKLGSFDVHRAMADLASRAGASGFASTSNDQIAAWTGMLQLVESEIKSLISNRPSAAEWAMLFEYEIPRRQRRIDVVLLADGAVLPIEMKHGAERFDRSSIWQAEDYALELRDFHDQSRGRQIIPVLWSTGVETEPRFEKGASFEVLCTGSDGLADAILEVVRIESEKLDAPIDPIAWDRGEYRPTPTIIEATQRLFAGHGVADISHSYADNLTATVDAIGREINRAQRENARVVCFVTGVPGAGKTLTGLAAAHEAQGLADSEAHAAYMSGNGPLVRVLREALARDSAAGGVRLKDARRRSETLVQNVHEFVREYAVANTEASPREHVVVFDEAQRAWHANKLKKRHPAINRSEPSLMLDIMKRAPGWCVLVALVGGGQEIHSGEAGLEEWGRALAEAPGDWRIVVSPEVLKGGASVGSHRLFVSAIPPLDIVDEPAMHLDVSVRSPRAQHLAEWVNAVLNLQPEIAAEAISKIDGFRISMTRDLQSAKSWLRDATREERRGRLLSSSGNQRLRAYGIEVHPEFLNACSLEHWFLSGHKDVRSSSALEIAMTEFKIQGLELDYTGVCWGDDLAIDPAGAWSLRRFSGSSWKAINNPINRQYLLNKYRVLLTRAREGMIIFVPIGDSCDATRDPKRLDRTARYLQMCGLNSVL